MQIPTRSHERRTRLHPDPQDFVLDLYKYEASVSVGDQIEPLMTQSLLSMLKH